MGMDKRPMRPDGSLYPPCETCGISPDRCKGFCIFQIIAKEAEQELNRRKEDGDRIQRHGRIKQK